MKILVTGATGNIGRKVVDHLLALGARDVRALTNDPGKAALPEGVEVAEGYLRRTGTLPAAFEGVDRMYLAPTPDTVAEVLALARTAGVRHVVDLSGEPESWWGGVTAAVEASGLAWTHLWPGDFMENTTIWAKQISETGAVREPYPHATSAPIAMTDIAAVAATALTAPIEEHAGRAHSLAGPEALSRTEQLRLLGDALGREIPFVRVSTEEAVEALAPSMGEDARWYVGKVLALFAETPGAASTAVEDLTGRPATTFAQWAAAHTGDFTG
ncbi:NAD(P)H-binding protein [Amycolatopsis sp. CA-230715]|uniref:NAD(P)H-binding protein n=1 Tax=Amycolatopsis sp. CA-230715 TaxID=2745196 RepID=UPI001C020544|nr:NAD(P)H-binding protein [Amycolatopsis sp. CA-230715]QWF77711.1 NAD(P)H azoreductase [Amycolatopsis sp. CA-230715]